MRTSAIPGVIFTLLVILLTYTAEHVAAIDPITTTSGIVVGTVVKDEVSQWLSIPYALPPIGNNRFKPPQAPPTSTSTVNARSVLPVCPQQPGDLTSGFEMTEDCLVLNIWSPKNASSLPVITFIHGGAFTSGVGSIYNGVDLSARENVVVVTLNYRLSILGFLSLPALVAESKANGGNGEGVGMFGLLDQQLALKWVKDNIALFGGNPQQVTIYGESAGAASVVAQLAIPSSKNLFRAAIVSSTYPGAFFTAAAAQSMTWNNVPLALNCPPTPTYQDVMSCLRNATFEQLNAFTLLKNFSFNGLIPVSPDGAYLTDIPYSLFQKKIWNQVPLFLGSDGHEMSTLLPNKNCNDYNNVENLRATAQGVNPAKVDKLLSLYPVNMADQYPYYEKIVEMLSDQNFRCPALNVLQFLQNAKMASYMYSWEVIPSWVTPACLRDGHGTELPYIFPAMLQTNWSLVNSSAGLTPAEVEVSRRFQKMVANFARTLDPSLVVNNASLTWPQFNSLQSPFVSISLENMFNVKSNFRDGLCKYWFLGQFVDPADVAWNQLPQGEYFNPKNNASATNWTRSPCPGLNTLANHGYLHRDGSKMYREDIRSAIWSVFHVDAGIIFDNLVNGPGPDGRLFGRVDPANNLTFFDLKDLDQHTPSVCEHDASLSRLDAHFGNQNAFNQDYYNQFISFAVNGSITLDSIARARVLRLNQCHKYNPDCRIGELQQRTGALEGALVVKVLSAGNNAGCPLAYVNSFFEKEQLPSDFSWNPVEQTIAETSGPVVAQILNKMALFIGTVPDQPIPGNPNNNNGNNDSDDKYSKGVVIGLIVALVIVAVIAIILLVVLMTRRSVERV